MPSLRPDYQPPSPSYPGVFNLLLQFSFQNHTKETAECKMGQPFLHAKPPIVDPAAREGQRLC
ncbi:hypothetical protein EVA_11446 [gut metagenome]|uniref:Uncharacterized protein n=1 Tax=gut metagenome TaxID=749906 RepID=J9GL44_9ZZZZ